MRRTILMLLTGVCGLIGLVTIFALVGNIVLSYRHVGHSIPDLVLWMTLAAFVLAITTITLTLVWHENDTRYGKTALAVAESVLLPLFLILLYGMVLVILWVTHA